MKPEVSAFKWVPPIAQGLVRDLRVRWALHEANRAYDELLIGPEDQSSPEYRKLQPFGQVPAYKDADLTLFESGAIVLHIAESHPVLLPLDPVERARAKTWMFAALNTVEPPILFYNQLQLMSLAEDNQVCLAVAKAVDRRLSELSAWLRGRSYLEEQFTAADLLMTTVLRILRGTHLLDNYPDLQDYQARCESRPAFQKALEDQLEVFREYEPA